GAALCGHRARDVHLVRRGGALAALPAEPAGDADHGPQGLSQEPDRRDRGARVLDRRRAAGRAAVEGGARVDRRRPLQAGRRVSAGRAGADLLLLVQGSARGTRHARGEGRGRQGRLYRDRAAWRRHGAAGSPTARTGRTGIRRRPRRTRRWHSRPRRRGGRGGGRGGGADAPAAAEAGAAPAQPPAEGAQQPPAGRGGGGGGRGRGGFGAGGTTVSAQQGLNQVTWNPRLDSPFTVPPRIVMWGGGGGRGGGPKAAPGTYTVKLSSGSWSQEQAFRLSSDPRLPPMTEADGAEQLKMAMDIG